MNEMTLALIWRSFNLRKVGKVGFAKTCWETARLVGGKGRLNATEDVDVSR